MPTRPTDGPFSGRLVIQISWFPRYSDLVASRNALRSPVCATATCLADQIRTKLDLRRRGREETAKPSTMRVRDGEKDVRLQCRNCEMAGNCLKFSCLRLGHGRLVKKGSRRFQEIQHMGILVTQVSFVLKRKLKKYTKSSTFGLGRQYYL